MLSVITTPPLGKLLHEFGDIKDLPDDQKVAYKPLLNWLKKKSFKLEANFPDTGEASLQVYFVLQATTAPTEEEVTFLLTLPGIDGAYEKPMEDLPG